MRLNIHVGYHKTATSWMQRQLFVPALGYQQLMTHDEVHRLITSLHPLAFTPDPVVELLEQRKSNQLANIVSSEILSGHPFYGSRENVEFANRLHTIEPQARIIITIRNQLKILVSVYLQYVRRGGKLTPSQFFRPAVEVGYNRFDACVFEYHRLVGFYHDLFGAENVLVLTQESLQRNPEQFIDSLSQFCGAPAASYPAAQRAVGVSDAEFIIPITRRLNHFRRDSAGETPFLNLGALANFAFQRAGTLSRYKILKRCFGDFRPVSQIVQREFSENFGESNKQLLDLCPYLDLHGYNLVS